MSRTLTAETTCEGCGQRITTLEIVSKRGFATNTGWTHPAGAPACLDARPGSDIERRPVSTGASQ